MRLIVADQLPSIESVAEAAFTAAMERTQMLKMLGPLVLAGTLLMAPAFATTGGDGASIGDLFRDPGDAPPGPVVVAYGDTGTSGNEQPAVPEASEIPEIPETPQPAPFPDTSTIESPETSGNSVQPGSE